jgi:ABC-type branched-subunit amino acid transport system substrate-binding protein
MVLSRLEKVYAVAATVAVLLTVGFGVGLYYALTNGSTTTTAATVQQQVLETPSASAQGGAAPATTPTPVAVAGQPATGGQAGRPGTNGTGPTTVTSGGSGAAGPSSAPVVPPTQCPFSDGTMQLGSVASISQSGFFQFPEAPNAAKAYFKNANGSGGVHGCQVNYTVLDDGTSATTGLSDAKTLVADDHVLAIVAMIAPFSQTQSSSGDGGGVDEYFASPGADNNNQSVPVVGLDPYEREAFDRPNQFGVDTDIYDAGVLMAKEAKRRFPDIQHPGVFGYKVSQLSEASGGAVDGFKAEGISNVDVQEISPSDSYYDQIAQTMIQQNHDDLLMWFCDIGCGRKFVDSAVKAGYSGPWVNYEIGYDPTYAHDYGQQGQAQAGMPVISPFTPYEANTPAVNTIRSVVNKFFPGTAFDSVTEQGWLGAEVFATEVDKLALSADRNYDQAQIIQALGNEASMDLGLTPQALNFHIGTYSRFQGRVAHRCVYFVTIQNGAYSWSGSDQTPRCP